MRRAEQLASEAGFTGAEEAFRRLDAGELDGTLIEAQLRTLRTLERGYEERELTTA